MESLWREFQMVLNNYTAYTKDFYDDYVELRRRDELETQLNQSHYRDIAKCTDTLTDLKLEINSKRNRHQMNKAHLLEVKKDLQSEYGKLKPPSITSAPLIRPEFVNWLPPPTRPRKCYNVCRRRGRHSCNSLRSVGSTRLTDKSTLYWKEIMQLHQH